MVSVLISPQNQRSNCLPHLRLTQNLDGYSSPLHDRLRRGGMGKSLFDNLQDARETGMELLHGNLMAPEKLRLY